VNLVGWARQPGGGLDEKCVDEGLRQVAAQLVLVRVELLAEQLRRSAGCAGALVPAERLNLLALLVQGQGGEEAAQQERSLGVGQRPGVVAEAVGVTVAGEVLPVAVQGRDGARVLRRDS